MNTHSNPGTSILKSLGDYNISSSSTHDCHQSRRPRIARDGYKIHRQRAGPERDERGHATVRVHLITGLTHLRLIFHIVFLPQKMALILHCSVKGANSTFTAPFLLNDHTSSLLLVKVDLKSASPISIYLLDLFDLNFRKQKADKSNSKSHIH